jgi:hypothetical protein
MGRIAHRRVRGRSRLGRYLIRGRFVREAGRAFRRRIYQMSNRGFCISASALPCSSSTARETGPSS